MAQNKGGGCVMPDISMCFGKDCDRREHCYRYKAKPNQVQTYRDLEHDCKMHNYRNQLEFKNNCEVLS